MRAGAENRRGLQDQEPLPGKVSRKVSSKIFYRRRRVRVDHGAEEGPEEFRKAT